MNKIIVVFRSKTDVFGYIDALSERGVPSSTVGTPKEARIGCGIAVEVDGAYLGAARAVLREKRFSGFYGVFHERISGGRRSLERLG